LGRAVREGFEGGDNLHQFPITGDVIAGGVPMVLLKVLGFFSGSPTDAPHF